MCVDSFESLVSYDGDSSICVIVRAGSLRSESNRQVVHDLIIGRRDRRDPRERLRGHNRRSRIVVCLIESMIDHRIQSRRTGDKRDRKKWDNVLLHKLITLDLGIVDVSREDVSIQERPHTRERLSIKVRSDRVKKINEKVSASFERASYIIRRDESSSVIPSYPILYIIVDCICLIERTG